MKPVLLLTVFMFIVPQAKLLLFDLPKIGEGIGNLIGNVQNDIFGKRRGIQGQISYDIGVGPNNDAKKDDIDDNDHDKIINSNDDTDYEDTKDVGDYEKNIEDESGELDNDSKKNYLSLSGGKNFNSDFLNGGLNGEVGIYSGRDGNKRRHDLLLDTTKKVQNILENDNLMKSIKNRNRLSGSDQFLAGIDIGNRGGINAIGDSLASYLNTVQDTGLNFEDLSRYSGNIYDLLTGMAINGPPSKLLNLIIRQKVKEIVFVLKLVRILESGGGWDDIVRYLGGNAENVLDYLRNLAYEGTTLFNQGNTDDFSHYFSNLEGIGRNDLSSILSSSNRRQRHNSFTDDLSYLNNLSNNRRFDNLRSRGQRKHSLGENLDFFLSSLDNGRFDNTRGNYYNNEAQNAEDNSQPNIINSLDKTLHVSDPSNDLDDLRNMANSLLRLGKVRSTGNLEGYLNARSKIGKSRNGLGGSAKIGYDVRGGIADNDYDFDRDFDK